MLNKKVLFEFYIFDKLLKKSMSVLNASEAHGIIVAHICMNDIKLNKLENIIIDILNIQQNKKTVFNFIKQLYIFNFNQIKKIDEFISLIIPKEESLYLKIKRLK